MRCSRLAVWWVAVALAAAAGGSAASGAKATGVDRVEHFRFDGRERTYLLHLPPNSASGKPMALVVALHYYTGSGRAEAEQTGFSAKADKERFVVVYPDGSIRGGNGLSWNIWHNASDPAGERDVAFVGELTRRVSKQHAIDPKRIYVTGMSQGGMLSHLIGGELSSVVAAVAPVGGFMTKEPPPGAPVSVMIVHGTADGVVPYGGGVLGGGGQRPNRGRGGRGDPMGRRVASVQEAVKAWVSRNGCSRKPMTTRDGLVTKEVYGGGRGGAVVVVYTVKGGGHNWPGDRNDKTGSGFKATDVIWEFFRAHPKR